MGTRIENYLDLIITNKSTIKESDTIIKIDLVQPLEIVLEEFYKHKDNITYYTLESSYKDIESLADNSTIDEIILFGTELIDIFGDYEELLLQTILTCGEHIGVYNLTDALSLFIDANSVGVPMILDYELYEYAYENGIILTDLPPFATAVDVENLFVRDYLMPSGFQYFETNFVGGWVDPEILFSLGRFF